MIPPGETTEEHRALQQEEAELIDKDRAIGATTGKGLFGFRFGDADTRHIPIIRDVEDGVDRCPRCTWELEDGLCESCGYGLHDGRSEDGTSDSDRSYYVGDELGDDFAAPHHMSDDMNIYGAIEGRDIFGGRATSVDSESVPNNYDDLDIDAYQALARARGRDQESTAASRHSERRHARQYHGSSSELDDEDDEVYPDTEQYSTDGTAGSLNEFIADELNERTPLAESSRGSHYGPDDGTEVATDYNSDYGGGGFSPYESGVDGHIGRAHSKDGMQNESDGDSEEGPMARRQPAGPASTDSDEDADILVMHERLQTRRNCGRSATSRLKNSLTGPHRQSSHRYRGTAYHGRSQQAPIEIGSDSDNPVPVPRSRRNRQIVDPESSDDDAGTRRSTSSGTVRRWSSRNSLPDVSIMQNSYRPRRDASPVIVDSSESRETLREGNRNDRNCLPGYPLQPRQTPGGGSRHSDVSSSLSSDAAHSPRISNAMRTSNSLSTPPAASNRTVSGRPSPSRSRISRAASRSRAHRTAASSRSSGSDGSRAAIAAAKAERRRMKQDRRQRNRDMLAQLPRGQARNRL